MSKRKIRSLYEVTVKLTALDGAITIIIKRKSCIVRPKFVG